MEFKKKYFARLDGDIIGIEEFIRFYAKDDIIANEIAEDEAESNYGGYDDPFNEDGCPNFYYEIAPYNKEEHDKYFPESLNSLIGLDWEIKNNYYEMDFSR